MEKKQKAIKILLYALLIALSLFMLVPFYWMVISSLKLNKDVFSIGGQSPCTGKTTRLSGTRFRC